MQQLDPGQGKTKRADLWAYRSNDLAGGPPIVVFDYQTSRRGQHAAACLEGGCGRLMVADYSGDKAMFAAGVTEPACWAHARRKFFDLDQGTPKGHPVAADILGRIARLWEIEAQAKAGTQAQRQALRREHTLPALQPLHGRLTPIRQTAAPGYGLAKACDYLLRRWPAFVRSADTGDLPIDNNPVANAIRPIAVGKKNWLLAGSEGAANVPPPFRVCWPPPSSMAWSPPHGSLKSTWEKLPTCPNNRIDELLPIKR